MLYRSRRDADDGGRESIPACGSNPLHNELGAYAVAYEVAAS